MANAFAHSELLSDLWIKRGITPNTLAAGSTVNTYGASPQPAAGIDIWDSGTLRFKNFIVVCDVSAVSGTGTLTLTLRDDAAALTSANGDANSVLALTFTAITAVGLYYSEVRLSHVFPATATRVVNDSTDDEVRRYVSLRAVAAGCNFTFGAWFIFGNNMRQYPVQDGTALSQTWATT